MLITRLTTFLAVSRRMNYTRAAEDLGLSQPAVSRQIAQLERDFGVPLIEQVGKTMHLTAAGEVLVREAERLLGDLDRVRERVRVEGDPDRGPLRIGASSTPGLYLLPALIGACRRERPELDLRFTVANTLTIERQILKNELDLGFVGGRLSSDELLTESVATDEIVCFAGAAHPLAARKRVAPADLAAETWVIREAGSATRQLFEARFRELGGVMKTCVELGSPDAVTRVVREGYGVAFGSRFGVADEVARGAVRVLPVSGLKVTRPILLVRHPDKSVNAAVRGFLERVKLAGWRKKG